MALEFGISGDTTLKNSVVKVEISSQGGSQDISYSGIKVAHILYPGDYHSDKGSLTYVRVENPPETYQFNFKKGETQEVVAYITGLKGGVTPIDIRSTSLVISRK